MAIHDVTNVRKGAPAQRTPRRRTSKRKRTSSKLAIRRKRDAAAIILWLNHLRGAIIVSCQALKHQNAEVDSEVAGVLQHYVANRLSDQIDLLHRLFSIKQDEMPPC